MQGVGFFYGLYILKVELCFGVLQIQSLLGSQVLEDSGYNFSKIRFGFSCVLEFSLAVGRVREKLFFKIWKVVVGGWNIDQFFKVSL